MKRFIIMLLLILLGTEAFAFNFKVNLPADIALQRLKDGNSRFTNYEMEHPNTDVKRRERMLNGQHPFAVILTCSDSVVPPEIIFDQGLGDLFVIRNAGNVLNEDVIGSIQYAVHHLGVNLVIVLGHQCCGIIGEAMKDNKETPEIESIKASFAPAIEKCKTDGIYSYENVIKTHAQLVVDELFENEDIKKYYKWHDLKIIPAYYNIGSGSVEFFK